MCSAFKSTVMSRVIAVSAKYGTYTGKELIGSTVGKWRQCHKGGVSELGTDGWGGTLAEKTSGRGEMDTALVLCHGRKRD